MTDDQLEDLLVRQGAAWRAAQPAAPSLSALPVEPRTGAARRPWLLPALAAASLLAPLLATFALLGQHEPDRARDRAAASPAPVLVPWADLSPGAPLGWDRLGPRGGAEGTLPEGTPQCEPGDFGSPSAVATSGDEAKGGYSGRYVLTVQRVGAEACAVGNNTPAVYLRDVSGQTLGVGRDPLLMAYPGYTLLQPGDVLAVPAQICGAGIASLELRLTAAPIGSRTVGQPAIPVSIPFTGRSSCTSGDSGTSHQSVTPAGSLNSLVQSYSVPSRVRSGQPLDYSVTLTNPSATPVSLQPCPSYQQALWDVLELPDEQGVTSAGQLNCAAAPASVPAHTSITFQLRLDTGGAPTGDRQLVWIWLGDAVADSEGYAQFPTVTVY